MSSVRGALSVMLLMVASATALAYEAYPRKAVTLEGRWTLNTQQSQDAEQILRARIERERERNRKEWERFQRSRANSDRAIPPLGAEGIDVPPATRAAQERVRRRQQREMDLYKGMLNVTPWLRIKQQGTRIEIASAMETRVFSAGSSSQVSMPEGQIADLTVGWDGDWFVIQRKAPRGPNAVERFRLLKKTDQLEYQMSWRGDTELAGISVKRIFDRATGEEPVRAPAVGPVR